MIYSRSSNGLPRAALNAPRRPRAFARRSRGPGAALRAGLASVQPQFDAQAMRAVFAGQLHTVAMARTAALADWYLERALGVAAFGDRGYGDVIFATLRARQSGEALDACDLAGELGAACGFTDFRCWINELERVTREAADWASRAARSAADALNFKQAYDSLRVLLRAADPTDPNSIVQAMAPYFGPPVGSILASIPALVDCGRAVARGPSTDDLLNCFKNLVFSALRGLIDTDTIAIGLNVVMGNIPAAVIVATAKVKDQVAKLLDDAEFRRVAGISEKDAQLAKAIFATAISSADLVRAFLDDGAEVFRREGTYQMLGGAVDSVLTAGTGHQTVAGVIGRAIARNADLIALSIRESPQAVLAVVENRYVKPAQAMIVSGMAQAQGAQALVQQFSDKGLEFRSVSSVLGGMGTLLTALADKLPSVPFRQLGTIDSLKRAGSTIQSASANILQVASVVEQVAKVANAPPAQQAQLLANALQQGVAAAAQAAQHNQAATSAAAAGFTPGLPWCDQLPAWQAFAKAHPECVKQEYQYSGSAFDPTPAACLQAFRAAGEPQLPWKSLAKGGRSTVSACNSRPVVPPAQTKTAGPKPSLPKLPSISAKKGGSGGLVVVGLLAGAALVMAGRKRGK